MLYPNTFIKTTTASDIDPSVSNQHELHGVAPLAQLFGSIPNGVAGRVSFLASIRIGNSGLPSPIDLTWYNARASTPDRHEYRLYYAANGAHIMRQLETGDDIIITKDNSGNIEIIIYPSRNSGYNQWTPTTI